MSVLLDTSVLTRLKDARVRERVMDLTVLHYDQDFDLIAECTGQPTEWIVPRGEID